MVQLLAKQNLFKGKTEKTGVSLELAGFSPAQTEFWTETTKSLCDKRDLKTLDRHFHQQNLLLPPSSRRAKTS